MKTLLPIVLLIVATAGGAQTVWRCGPDGRVYADSPCPGGRELQWADPRSPEQRAERREALAREAAMTKTLVAERREREAELRQRGPGLIGIKPVAVPAPAAKSKKRPADPGTWPSAAQASRQRRG